MHNFYGAILLCLVVIPQLSSSEPRPLTPADIKAANRTFVCSIVGNLAEKTAYFRDTGRYSLHQMLRILVAPPGGEPGNAGPFVAGVAQAVAIELYRDPTITQAQARAYGERECRRLYPAP